MSDTAPFVAILMGSDSDLEVIRTTRGSGEGQGAAPPMMADSRNLCCAVQVLRRSGVIAYPTESCFGIGGDPVQAVAVRRLLRLKRRPQARGGHLAGARYPRGDRPHAWPAPRKRPSGTGSGCCPEARACDRAARRFGRDLGAVVAGRTGSCRFPGTILDAATGRRLR